MDLGSLLRGGRVVGAVLRLVGRYRLASFIGLGVVVGWFVLGLQGDAHAADGRLSGHTGGPGVFGTFDRTDYLIGAGPIGYPYGGPDHFDLWFAVTVLGGAVVLGVYLWFVARWVMRLDRVPVRDAALHGTVRRDPGGAVLPDVDGGGSARHGVGV